MERGTTRERRKDGTLVVMVIVMAQVGGGWPLKVALPVFEARLIKTLVQYLQRRGRGKEEVGEKWAKARL